MNFRERGPNLAWTRPLTNIGERRFGEARVKRYLADWPFNDG